MAIELGSGSRVGDYLLERKLGGGSFGSVWLARREGGSQVAIKLLTGAQATGDRAAVRAEVELLAASASSRSRHVVRVLGGGVEPVPYIVMEYVEGRDLSQVLTGRGTLPPAEVVPLGIAMADALQALMEAGIIHRDVKPANVLIDNDGTAKLADFGIAKIVGMDTVTMTGQLPMTMAYAAPEVWDGHVSHQSDLYALGVVLYQCLVGAPPFSGNYGALYKAHKSELPDFDALPSETPPSLRSLITACMEKEPAGRPNDAAVVLDLLYRAAAELTAPPTPEPTHFGPWRRRAPHPRQPWAWRCVHDGTGEMATVEVHAFEAVSDGEKLRRAVEVNPQLVPFGAERLLGTSRLILRPGEAFVEAPAAPILFWVARDQQPAAPPTGEISTPRLRRIVDSLFAMQASAKAALVDVSFDPPNLTLLSDATLHVRRPGLAASHSDPSASAMTFLRGLPLDEDSTAFVERSQDLEALSKDMAGGAAGVIHGVARAGGGVHAGASPNDVDVALQVAASRGPERFMPGTLPPVAAGFSGGGEPPVARTGLGAFWDWVFRHRLPLAGGAGIVGAVAVATAAFGFWEGDPPPPPTTTPTATRTITKTPARTGTPTIDLPPTWIYCATQVARQDEGDPACSVSHTPAPSGTRSPGTPAPGNTVVPPTTSAGMTPPPVATDRPVDTPVPTQTPVPTPGPFTNTVAPPTPTQTPTILTQTIATSSLWPVYNAEWVEGRKPARYDLVSNTAQELCPSAVCPGWQDNSPATWIWAPGTTATTTGAGNARYYFLMNFKTTGEILEAQYLYAFNDGIRTYIDDKAVGGGVKEGGDIWRVDATILLDSGTTHTIEIWGVNGPCPGDSPGPSIGSCTYGTNPAGITARLIIRSRQ